MENSRMEHPCLNIIYDDRIVGKKQLLLNEFAEQGITDYKFWECIVLPNVVESINASHKMIVRDAKERGLKEVCIGEDDLSFTCKGAWDYFLNNKPEQFDLYLWGSYLLPLSNNMVCGFQLYIINESLYDRFLGTPNDVHIDTEMDKLNADIKFCFPFPALQRSGYSANNKAVVNYNDILTKHFPDHIYNGNPIHNIP